MSIPPLICPKPLLTCLSRPLLPLSLGLITQGGVEADEGEVALTEDTIMAGDTLVAEATIPPINLSQKSGAICVTNPVMKLQIAIVASIRISSLLVDLLLLT